ncbi:MULTISPECIES: hypothetical protein [Nocardiaceae]|uniref:hypothetical protein n=1 Tax=Nocardiaceae TaxID=85025 RepID=UPI00068E4823|nr:MULTISPECIES: hypothetical protein [Rhodococcus]OZF41285.1 hypothetical protein CH292_27695 [Rhodococcus sp. 14-2470-1a]OZF41397.1 hypothetical protein CH292_28290 [Rhodococcus sp. 14-2470-1a]
MSIKRPWRRAASTASHRDLNRTAAQRQREQHCESIDSAPVAVLDDNERRELERAAESKNIAVSWRARLHLGRDAAARSKTVGHSRDAETLRGNHMGLSGRGGGKAGPVLPLTEFRATTLQAAGMWPFPVGAGAPIVGVPLGVHLYTGAPVCFDPLSWMTRARFLQQPSMMLLGLPGFGKSTLARKIILGLIYAGVSTLIMGDMRPDYRKLVEALGDRGQIIDLGLGRGQINPLDMGPLAQILATLDAAGTDAADKTAALVRKRIAGDRVRRVKTLLQVTRGNAPIDDFEISALGAAIRLLEERFTGDVQPLLSDLADVLEEGPDPVRRAFKSDTDADYRADSKTLRRTLNALIDGEFGEVFCGQTTVPIDINAAAVCVDVSGIGTADKTLKGAVLLACWEHGFAATDAAHYLADAGCGPRRNFLVVLDEMWQVLRAGVGMVDRVDELTRLNRAWGTALLMCTHTISDLESLPNPEDVATAKGLVERAGVLVVGALPRKEMTRLSDIKPFTDTEIADITSWSSPKALTGEAGALSAPPGQGKFIVKLGEQGAPGIPFRTVLMPSEIESGVHDTNHRFTFVGDDLEDDYDEVA